MEQSELFILLMLVLASVSALLLKMLTGRKQITVNFARAVWFFFCVSYFLVSGAKLFLGEDESTLLESLWDIHYITFVHYALPLCVTGAALPCLIVLLLKKKAGKYIDLFDTGIIAGGILSSVVCGGILGNFYFCILFAVCALLALLLTFLYQDEISYFGRGEYAEGCRMILPPALLAVVMLLLYFPGELFVANPDEFPCAFWGFLGTLVLGSLALAAAAVVIGLFFLPKSVIRLMSFLVFGLLAAGYLQALFLNGKLEILNGEELQAWSLSRQIINIAIWILVVGLIVFAGYRKSGMWKVYRTVCIYICLIQAVSLGYMVITTDLANDDKSCALTTSGSLELSGEDNVLVFILDRFDSETFEKIMADDNGYLEPLSDFTYYDNATSQFSMTRSSIPYLLTGVPWNGELPDDYVAYAYQEGRVLQAMSEKDYDMGIYAAVEYYSPLLYGITDNYSDHAERHCIFGETVAMMYKTSMYKMMPFTWKNKYSYYSSDIYDIVSSEGIWNIENDIPFYQGLIHEGLALDETVDKAFRFYHMRGVHPPYYLSENMEHDKTGRQISEMSQARGSLKIVYEYLRQMQELGVYDSATIVITADHGQRVDIGGGITSRPVLLVKEAGAMQESMTINSAQVSQENLTATLLKAADIDWQGYEKPLEEVPPGEERERTYVDFSPDTAIQYSINGDVKEIENWGIKLQKTY